MDECTVHMDCDDADADSDGDSWASTSTAPVVSSSIDQ